MHELSYQLTQGIVVNLIIRDTHVNYLQNSQQSKNMSGLAAVVHAATGEPGAVHNAQAATSDGDPVTGFTMNVNGKLIIGSFWKVGFKDGDSVQVAGYQKNNERLSIIY